MKKAIPVILLSVTLSFCIFMVGVLVGRQFNPTIITKYIFQTDSVADGTTKDNAPIDLKIDINTATAEELTQLPGIGPLIANKIVAYRTENGNFRAVEDLKKVNGIGDSRLADIMDYITVGG